MKYFSSIYRHLRPTLGLNPHLDGTIHFLHVGKTAGTQIKDVIDQVNRSGDSGKLLKHGHGTSLRDLPPGHDYFFSTRDPIARFRSGFYSRRRKGRPTHFSEWTEHERFAFARFPHANDLAEALFAPGQPGRDAISAIRSISHCSSNLVDWFRFCGYLFELRPPVWIIRQEQFSADLGVFLRRIGYKGCVDIAPERQKSHASDYVGIPDLSDTARANLRQWYAQDYAFLDLCEIWLTENAVSPSVAH